MIELREQDPKPCFAGFVVGHEGVARGGKSSTDGSVDQHWADDAVQSLADAFDSPRRGGATIPCYMKHSNDFNAGADGRDVVGHVEAARTIKRKGRWEAHSVIYVPDGDARKDLVAGKIDVCSPECDVESMRTVTGGIEVVRVLQATGLALGSTNHGDMPAFGGATFTSAIQMFADGATHTNAETKGRRPMEKITIESKEDLLMAISQMQGAGIITENDLLNIPIVKSAFERDTARDRAKADAGSKENSNRSTSNDSDAVKEMQAKLDKQTGELNAMKTEAKLPEILNAELNKAAGVDDTGKHNLTEKEVEGILGTIKGNKYTGTDEQIGEKVAEDIKPGLNLVNLGRSNASNTTTQTTKPPATTQSGKGTQERKTGDDHEGFPKAMVDESLRKTYEEVTGTGAAK